MASLFSGRRKPANGDDDDQADVRSRSQSVTQQPLGFDTVLGATSVLEGTFKSSGNIRLDGTFTGTLEITGNVLVGETAKINADIDAKNISVAGTVRGNVTGNRVQILRTGRVWGDIQAAALTTEEGAFIDGKISMNMPEEPTPEPEANDEPVEVTPEADTVVDAEVATEDADDDDTKEKTDD
jgi:cytoskeletal protein CcmA (bactofilin family)